MLLGNKIYRTIMTISKYQSANHPIAIHHHGLAALNASKIEILIGVLYRILSGSRQSQFVCRTNCKVNESKLSYPI